MFGHAKSANKSDGCPTQQALEAYPAGRLLGRRNEQVFQHLKYCSSCLRALAALKRVPSPGELIQPASKPHWWQRLFRRNRQAQQK